MGRYDFNHKKFSILQNSGKGKVNSETTFEYRQDGNLVTADYSGGSIRYGKILAELNGDILVMLYQCMTTDNQLKAGKAKAHVSLTKEGKMKLDMEWEWLTGGKEKGTSEYLEN